MAAMIQVAYRSPTSKGPAVSPTLRHPTATDSVARGALGCPAMASRRIGILTGGGDVPGLNSVIKSVVYRSTELGYEIMGIRRGWEGLTHSRPTEGADREYARRLDRENTRTIDRTGGTILHTSRTNPRRIPKEALPRHLTPEQTSALETGDGSFDLTPIVVDNVQRLGLDAL